ncbi:MAG: TIGR02450 family Trp-rich protein, partial [Cyanobacteria bacterium P01_E01_bin.43]
MAKKQKFPHLIGSKWTAQQKTFGWRHFHVVNRKNQDGLVFAEMV